MDNQGWGTREGPKLPANVDEAKVKRNIYFDLTFLILCIGCLFQLILLIFNAKMKNVLSQQRAFFH